MPPHARKLYLFASCLTLALVCADARVRTQDPTPRRVTATPESATNLNPSLGGDGRHMIFESTADLAHASAAPQFLAYAADVSDDSTSFALLAASRAPAAAISQDGSLISFSSAEDLTGENADRNSEIFLSTRGRLTQLTHTTPADPSSRTRDGNFRPSISDDGRLVAFSSNRNLTGANADGSFEIFLYDIDARRFAQITNNDSAPNAHDAKLSGDGSRVAFVLDKGASAGPPSARLDLVVCQIASKSCSTVAENVAGLSLSPARAASDDGSRVVFSAQTATNTAQVFLYDGRNGGLIRQLTKLGSRATDVPLNPTISGDGSRVAFATRRSVVGGNSDASVELYLFDIPSNQITRVTDAP
ncbi:MAG: hypothetical protein M3268_00360, partial [Acidobacteriota bacterium]|nr:hypothetical protein [Acidobacteriota bacterium]